MNAIDQRVARLMHQAKSQWPAGQIEAATQNYRDVIALDPGSGVAAFYLAQIYQQTGKYSWALALFERARELLERATSRETVANLEMWCCLGATLGMLGQYDRAIEILQLTVDLWPLCLPPRSILAAYCLLTGDLVRGFAQNEYRTTIPSLNATGLPARRWRGKDLTDKTIILQAEQGFGDVLQFSRYIPMVRDRGGRVLLRTGRLNRLLSSVDGVDRVIANDEPLPSFDFCASIVSLPAVFETSIETIPATVPYLEATPANWLDRVPGLKVGLCWAGQDYPGRIDDDLTNRRRSIALPQLMPVLAVAGCSFVSLQLGQPAVELRHIPAGKVHDVSSRLLDWADTASLVSGLDLVIAVDTAVAHLAGALGRPIWLLNRFDTCWRWLQDRADSPWYPTMRIYRQQKEGEWAPVIARVAADLRKAAGR